MLKGLIRLLGFFTKELNEVRRQPRLVLALILGPFLILLLFGLGYQASPRLRAILVIPDNVAQEFDTSGILVAANLTYDVQETTNDENAALQKLNNREVDVVEVIPSDVRERIERGEAAPVTFHYAEINPLNETWIQSLGYAQVNEMNKALLMQTAMSLQEDAKANQVWVNQFRTSLDAMAGDPTNLDAEQESIRRLRTLLATMVASPVLAAQVAANGDDPEQVKAELNALAADLEALDQAISNQTLAQEAARLEAVRARVAQFDDLLTTFSSMPPQVIVSPLQPTYENVQGQALTLANFYAPGVLALILQHIAVTLGALSERLLGAIELFRVAPVSTRQVLLGKYLAYALFICVVGGVLALAMSWMQVPFRGALLNFAIVLALLVIGGLGIGFLISTVSKSDSQAVQLSMLVLLVSIFFSGFFLPLENFWLPVRILGYMLPITPGIEALQDVMLRGMVPSIFAWLLLGGLAVVTFILANLFAGRQLRFS
jgi:ABC-2 type transport system permease protein